MNLVISNFYISRKILFPVFLLSTLRGAAILLPVTLIAVGLGKTAFWAIHPSTEILSLIAIIFYLKFFFKEAKRVDKSRIFSVTLHSNTDELSTALSALEGFCEKWEADLKQTYYVQMTVEEMCSAIIQNGFIKEKKENGIVQLTLVSHENHDFSLHIRDNAFSFNPFEMNKKKLRDIDDTSVSDFNALGMDVIKKKSKSFYYRRYQGFNTMVVKI